MEVTSGAWQLRFTSGVHGTLSIGPVGLPGIRNGHYPLLTPSQVASLIPLTWPPHPRSRVNLLPILEPNGRFSGTDSVYLAAWPKHRLGESSRAFHDSYSGIDGEVNFDLVGGLQ